ncbi:MAG: nuclear transport factor 2 family protein [Candidatus Limnocylindria bacterium]
MTLTRIVGPGAAVVALTVATACSALSGATPVPATPTPPPAAAVVREFLEALNAGDVDRATELVSPDAETDTGVEISPARARRYIERVPCGLEVEDVEESGTSVTVTATLIPRTGATCLESFIGTTFDLTFEVENGLIVTLPTPTG